jgi:hypothetical protein
MYTRQGIATVGAPWRSAMGREIMAPYYLPEWVRQCTLAPRISQTDRSNELRLVP